MNVLVVSLGMIVIAAPCMVLFFRGYTGVQAQIESLCWSLWCMALALNKLVQYPDCQWFVELAVQCYHCSPGWPSGEF